MHWSVASHEIPIRDSFKVSLPKSSEIVELVPTVAKAGQKEGLRILFRQVEGSTLEDRHFVLVRVGISQEIAEYERLRYVGTVYLKKADREYSLFEVRPA